MILFSGLKENPALFGSAIMRPMKNAGSEQEAMSAFIRIGNIVKDQKALEEHQRAHHASFDTLQDSMVFAYDAIVRIMKPFIDDEL